MQIFTFPCASISLLQRLIRSVLCGLFLVALAVACYRRPIPDDFDRYMYEAIVLSKSEPVETVYEKVKHENPRAEGSSVLDSPQHMRELEPLYAIRPLYIRLVALLSAVLPVQHAINFVSAVSFLGIGIVVLLWTQRPIQTALLMMVYQVMNLGRGGTPDALAALLVIAALWLIDVYGMRLTGLALLFISLGVRTDNLLVLFAVLAWMLWEQMIPAYAAITGAVAAVGIVLGINHWAGNYGWIVLFRYSFIAGKYPATIPHTLTVREYLTGFSAGIGTALTQSSIWILIGLWAWTRKPHALLLVASSAVIIHFLLFPSAEVRYLIWAGILAAVILIHSFGEGPAHRSV
jgi:hypothetical protein